MFIKIKNSFWSVLPSRKSYYPKTKAWSQHIMRTASLSSRGFDSRDAGEPDFFPSPSPPPLSPSDFERSTYPNWTATPSARMESGHSVVEVTVFGESFLFLFLIGGKLFYSVGLVSAIQQSESPISTQASNPGLTYCRHFFTSWAIREDIQEKRRKTSVFVLCIKFLCKFFAYK